MRIVRSGLATNWADILSPNHLISHVRRRSGCPCAILSPAEMPAVHSGDYLGFSETATLFRLSVVRGILSRCGDKSKPFGAAPFGFAQDKQGRPCCKVCAPRPRLLERTMYHLAPKGNSKASWWCLTTAVRGSGVIGNASPQGEGPRWQRSSRTDSSSHWPGGLRWHGGANEHGLGSQLPWRQSLLIGATLVEMSSRCVGSTGSREVRARSGKQAG